MKRIIDFFFEIGSLRKIARGHRQSFLTDDISDNIASHSHRVAVIGYFLAKAEGVNIEKVLTMCTFHDSGETRSGDQTWIHKRYVKVFDDEILNDQIKDLTEDNSLFKIMSEYAERKTKEANVAKDADRLDQFLLAKEYIARGNKVAEKWIRPGRVDEFYCDSAKKLFNQLLESEPWDWSKDLFTDKRR